MTHPPDQRHAATTANRMLQCNSCTGIVLAGHTYIRHWVPNRPGWVFVQCTDCARLAATPKDPQRGAI